MIGPVKVPETVKITAITYRNFIRDILSDWLDKFPLSEVNIVIYMHDNAQAHAAEITTELLSSMAFEGDTLMKWPAYSLLRELMDL